MSIQIKLILWLISVGVVLGALFGAYRFGRHVEGLDRDAQLKDAVIAAVAQANELAATDKAVALKAAQRAADRRAAHTESAGRVENSIEAHTEYTACALSAADLAELNHALDKK